MGRRDNRTLKTVKAVQTTALKLMCRKRIGEIKIVELCAEADINRTTFYLHFDSVAGVLESLKNEIVERVFSESEQGGTIDLTHIENPLPFLTACTDVLNSYEYFEEFVRGGPNADMFLTDLKDSFAQRVFRSYVDSDGKNAQDAIFVIRFLTAGVLDIYTEWLKTDKQVPFLTILSKCAPIVSAGQNILANAARIR